MVQYALGLLAFVAASAPALAQTLNLTEKTTLGDKAKYSIDLELKGNLIVALPNGKQPIPLEATARHRLIERVMAMTEGLPTTSARYYAEATATASVGGEKTSRTLPPERRLIISKRDHEGRQSFALSGPLSRDELELVTDHFNPQCLPGLLPAKAINVGDSWSVSAAAVQAACSYDATLKSSLAGKLTAIKDGLATFTLEGTTEGVENGARATMTISATGTYDIASGHIIGLIWKQKDEREQGPVNPASQVDATVTFKREAVPAESKELSDEALSALPAGNTPARLLGLRYMDSRGRYQILHTRDWHVTGQTDSHLVLRLLDRGELVAQATVTVWGKMETGKHLSADDFKKAVASAPGWTPGKTLFDREIPAPAGMWLFKLTMEGKMEEVPVVQSFYFLAGAEGEQVVVTVAAKPEKLKALGTKDLDLVNAIGFGKK